MNHTNKIECRQNENNTQNRERKRKKDSQTKTTTTISRTAFRTRLRKIWNSHALSLLLYGPEHVCFAVAASFLLTLLATAVAAATHSQPTVLHAQVHHLVRWIHTSSCILNRCSLSRSLCVCFFFVCSVRPTDRPFVYVILFSRRAWIDWISCRYSQFQRNTSTELMFIHVRSSTILLFLHRSCEIFSTQ